MQWIRFSHSTRAHSTTSRPCLTRPQFASPQLESGSKEPGAVCRPVVPRYNQRGYASGPPGPLEARKRNASRKHTTGVSGFNAFDRSQDREDTSLQEKLDWARTSIDRTLAQVKEEGKSPLHAMKLAWNSVFRAPVGFENQSQELELHRITFVDLLEHLGIDGAFHPQNIVELIEQILSLEPSQRTKVLDCTREWLRHAISRGIVNERLLIGLLDVISHVLPNANRMDSLDIAQTVSICDTIVVGLFSTKDDVHTKLHYSTIKSLVCSISVLHFYSEIPLSPRLSQLLQTTTLIKFGIDGPKMLCSAFGYIPIHGKHGGEQLSTFLDDLPRGVVKGAILLHIDRTVKSATVQEEPKTLELLRPWWFQLRRTDYWTADQPLNPENELASSIEPMVWRLGMPYISQYLENATEAEICEFVLRHVGELHIRSVLKSCNAADGLADSRAQEWRAKQSFRLLPPAARTYPSLIQILTLHWPGAVVGATSFIFRFLRQQGDMSGCLAFTEYILVKRRAARPRFPRENFMGEITKWAQQDANFALVMLSLDRRWHTSDAPVISEVLLRMDSESVPDEIMNKITLVILRNCEEQLKMKGPDILHAYFPTLQILLPAIAKSKMTSTRAFRHSQRIMKMLALTSDSIKSELAATIFEIVVVKSLEERRKIPNYRLEWLAQVVAYLQGLDKWQHASSITSEWWMEIVNEEFCKGREWRWGKGWVRRTGEDAVHKTSGE